MPNEYLAPITAAIVMGILFAIGFWASEKSIVMGILFAIGFWASEKSRQLRKKRTTAAPESRSKSSE